MNTNIFFRRISNQKTAIFQRNIFQFLDQIFNLKIARVMNLILLLGVGNSWGQTTIFTEAIGTCCSTTNTSIALTTFDNSGLIFSGSADTRTSTVSSGYTGASGGRNVFITNIVGRDFMISGINTTGYSSLALTFGHHKNTTASNNELMVEVSSDGINWTALSYSRATGTGTATWALITPTGIIPATANLRIRFRQTSTTPQFRVDDIKLVGTINSLPVTWNEKYVNTLKNGNEVVWSTSSEQNTSHFEVEYSDDAVQFYKVSENIPAAGNSSTTQYYKFLHESEMKPWLYYRVKQVDLDGKIDYSKIVIAKRASKLPDFKVLIYPIPLIEGDLTLDIHSLAQTEIQIQIIDLLGKEVYREKVPSKGYRTQHQLQLDHLPKGQYQIQIDNSIFSHQQRLVLMK
jgi:hypothetical protein